MFLMFLVFYSLIFVYMYDNVLLYYSVDLLANLERLLLKTLKFEKVLEMFSDPTNIDNASEFANALAKVCQCFVTEKYF